MSLSWWIWRNSLHCWGAITLSCLYSKVLRAKDCLLDNCRISSTTSFQARYCLSTFHFSFHLIFLVPTSIPLCRLLLFPSALLLVVRSTILSSLQTFLLQIFMDAVVSTWRLHMGDLRECVWNVGSSPFLVTIQYSYMICTETSELALVDVSGILISEKQKWEWRIWGGNRYLCVLMLLTQSNFS